MLPFYCALDDFPWKAEVSVGSLMQFNKKVTGQRSPNAWQIK